MMLRWYVRSSAVAAMTEGGTLAVVVLFALQRRWY
jgi:hypothetical protein